LLFKKFIREGGEKMRCKRCGKKLIVKDGSLDRERKIKCGKCGKENSIKKKKNGKIIIV